MALKFYFDTHIAKAIAVQLRAQGVDVVRCEEVDMAEASDEEHLRYAADKGYVMVSQDADFADLHTQWQQDGHKHADILRIPRSLKGTAQISFLVRVLIFYDQAERGGALNVATDIENQLIYL